MNTKPLLGVHAIECKRLGQQNNHKNGAYIRTEFTWREQATRINLNVAFLCSFSLTNLPTTPRLSKATVRPNVRRLWQSFQQKVLIYFPPSCRQRLDTRMPVESLHEEDSASLDVLLERILTTRWRPPGTLPESPLVSHTETTDETIGTEAEEVTAVVETVAVATKVDSDLGEPSQSLIQTD